MYPSRQQLRIPPPAGVPRLGLDFRRVPTHHVYKWPVLEALRPFVDVVLISHLHFDVILGSPLAAELHRLKYEFWVDIEGRPVLPDVYLSRMERAASAGAMALITRNYNNIYRRFRATRKPGKCPQMFYPNYPPEWDEETLQLNDWNLRNTPLREYLQTKLGTAIRGGPPNGVMCCEPELAALQETRLELNDRLPDGPFTFAVEGVFPEGSPTEDCKRPTTPRAAMAAGADVIFAGKCLWEGGRGMAEQIYLEVGRNIPRQSDGYGLPY